MFFIVIFTGITHINRKKTKKTVKSSEKQMKLFWEGVTHITSYFWSKDFENRKVIISEESNLTKLVPVQVIWIKTFAINISLLILI